MERLESQLKFDFLFTVPNTGKSGGLCAIWRENANLMLRSYSSNHIDLEVRDLGDVNHWRILSFMDFWQKRRGINLGVCFNG